MLVAAYLAAAVLANLAIYFVGPDWMPCVAFVAIGLDLASRDRLHEKWEGPRLWPRMIALVVAGSLLSYLVVRDVERVAIASAISFLLAGMTDAVVYHRMTDAALDFRMNTSNVISSAVDSILFPAIAFGIFSPRVTLLQWLAKVIGGAIWTWLLLRKA